MKRETLIVKKLSAGYGDRTVLHEINFSVPEHDIKVILGGSGCGKTTLLKNIIGLEEPFSGNVNILGKDFNVLDMNERNDFYKRIGVLFQNGALLGSLTVEENLSLPLKIYTKLPDDIIQEIVYMKLSLVNMAQARFLLPSELSGGMKKRVALARALILDPQVLFCDEPSAGLDPVTASELDKLILNIRDLFSITIIVVTHELRSIETIADSILMLDQGSVIFDGTVENARKSKILQVREFFLN